MFTVYRVQGEIREDRYIEFAGVHAGAPSGEDSDYYEHIGFWNSLEQWQDIVRRVAAGTAPVRSIQNALGRHETFAGNAAEVLRTTEPSSDNALGILAVLSGDHEWDHTTVPGPIVLSSCTVTFAASVTPSASFTRWPT